MRKACKRGQPLLVIFVILLLPSINARGESPHSAPTVGDEFEIGQRYETSERTGDGPSGSSRGQNTFLERVIGVRESGLELEFDLPRDATVEERARTWQFPVRVFRSPDKPTQLLNRPELDARLEEWLKAAGWTRAACGRWIFTWNAFQIECDPQSFIKTIEELDLRFVDLRDGAPYQDTEARGAGALTKKTAGSIGETFVVTMEISPDAVQRARAESDVVVGEIVQKPVSLADALNVRSKESVSGTISVTLETDSKGNLWRRIKVTETEIKGPDGQIENRTATETVERRSIPKLATAQ